MLCFEHKECSASNTRNVLLRTEGTVCFEHKENSASNARNVLLRTQGMFCFALLRTQGMSCLEHISFRTTKVSLRCSCPIVIDFTSRLISYSQFINQLTDRSIDPRRHRARPAKAYGGPGWPTRISWPAMIRDFSRKTPYTPEVKMSEIFQVKQCHRTRLKSKCPKFFK